MLFQDISFRETFAKLILLQYDASHLFDGVDGLSWPEKADAVLCYPYYDPEVGLTLDILAPVEFATGTIFYAMSLMNFGVRSVLRCDVFGECEAQCLAGASADAIKSRYAEQCAKDDEYWNTDEVLSFLLNNVDVDSLRHPLYPLDVRVYLVNEPSGGEIVWMNLCGRTENGNLVATLLNHPCSEHACDIGDVMVLDTFVSDDGGLLLFTGDDMLIPSDGE